MGADNEEFYLVRSDVLPEAMHKTIEAKALLDIGRVKTIFEAVHTVGLSRSAFYKYKDTVFPFKALMKEKIVTLFFHLQDSAGALSKLLSVVSTSNCNILTIHQTIPIQKKANVTLSLDMTHLDVSIGELIHRLQALDFVERVDILSSGV